MADDLRHEIEPMLLQIESYNKHTDKDLIRKAFEFAYEKHINQKRDDGQPYIVHPIATAKTLISLQLDDASIMAALLHDVVEDQDVTLDDLKEKFGEDVANLVDGVTKLKFTEFDFTDDENEESSDSQLKQKRGSVPINKSAENIRKIFLAMAKDLRVMVIKLADRLHNMQTLDALSDERKTKTARETMQIYAPLAHRLGIWTIKWELEDLAFRVLKPKAYREITEKLAKTREERESDIAEAVDMLQRHLETEGIEATIQSRPKHLWSIYQKMIKQKLDFDDIYDLSAMRVIVNKVEECYYTLGVVHDLWMPIPDMFSDYIAKPKSNMYQSLHTKVIGPKGEPLEIQIRTMEMHKVADFGVAAHWQYKEQMQSQDEFQKKLSWLRQQLFDWQNDSKDAGEFLSSVVNDLFADQVFVFTPRGDVIDLPAGSTPVDFAYRIHSDVGNHCVGARVNGRIVPLTHVFSNGDIAEIISRSNAQPSLDWLKFVKTSQARNRIKRFFRQRNEDDFAIRGREALERELERANFDVKATLKSEKMDEIIKHFGYTNETNLFVDIGYGVLSPITVVNRFKTVEEHLPAGIVTDAPGARALTVPFEGLDSLMITRAKCCSPLPGEPVVGYITRGKGVALHSGICPNIIHFKKTEPERLLEISWNDVGNEKYKTTIRIHTIDRIGLLNEITAIFSEEKINIAGANIKSLPDKTVEIVFALEVSNFEDLRLIMDKINMMKDVLSVERLTNYSAKQKKAKKAEKK